MVRLKGNIYRSDYSTYMEYCCRLMRYNVQQDKRHLNTCITTWLDGRIHYVQDIRVPLASSHKPELLPGTPNPVLIVTGSTCIGPAGRFPVAEELVQALSARQTTDDPAATDPLLTITAA